MSTYGFLMQRERMTTERLTSMWLPEARGDASSRPLHYKHSGSRRSPGADPVFMQNASSTGKRQTK
jgi:hypothetical protein